MRKPNVLPASIVLVAAILLCLLFLAVACSQGNETTTSSAAATSTSTTTAELSSTTSLDTTTTSVRSESLLEYATNFSLERQAGGNLLLTDSEGQKFLLANEGGAGAQGAAADVTVIRTPVKRVVCMSTTQVCLLRPLDALDVVVGVSADRDSWYIDQIKEGIDSGRVMVVATGMGEPDYEKVTALKPDVVITYTASGTDSEKSYAKFKELGVTTIVDNSWLENDPLARMEWLKVMGALVGKYAEAQQYFDLAKAQVSKVEQTVAAAETKPKVLWGMTMDGTTFWVDRGQSYPAKAVKIAGGDYLFSDVSGTGSAEITLEEVYKRAQEADIWIFSSMQQYFMGLDKLFDAAPMLADLKCVKNNQFWLYQPWYWQTVDLTQDVITDLAAMFHPDLFPGHEIKHFVKAQ